MCNKEMGAMYGQAQTSSTTWMYVLAAAVLFMVLFVNGRKCTGDDEHREYKRNVLGMCKAKKCEDGYESDDDGVCQLLPTTSPSTPRTSAPASGTAQNVGLPSASDGTFSLSGGSLTGAGAAAAGWQVATRDFLDYISTDASVSTKFHKGQERFGPEVTSELKTVTEQTFTCPTFDEDAKAWDVKLEGDCNDRCGTCWEVYTRKTHTLECPQSATQRRPRQLPEDCYQDCVYEPWQAVNGVAGAGTEDSYHSKEVEGEPGKYERDLNNPAEGYCTRACIHRAEEVILPGKKRHEDDVIEGETYTDTDQCKQACEAHPDCKAVDKDGTTCRLLKADKGTVTAATFEHVTLATEEPGTAKFTRGIMFEPSEFGKTCQQVDIEDSNRCEGDVCKWLPGATQYTKACNVFECPIKCQMQTEDTVFAYVWSDDVYGQTMVKCINGLETKLFEEIGTNVSDKQYKQDEIVAKMRSDGVGVDEKNGGINVDMWTEPVDGQVYTLWQIEKVNFIDAKYGGEGGGYCPISERKYYLSGTDETDYKVYHVVEAVKLGTNVTITHRYVKPTPVWEQDAYHNHKGMYCRPEGMRYLGPSTDGGGHYGSIDDAKQACVHDKYCYGVWGAWDGQNGNDLFSYKTMRSYCNYDEWKSKPAKDHYGNDVVYSSGDWNWPAVYHTGCKCYQGYCHVNPGGTINTKAEWDADPENANQLCDAVNNKVPNLKCRYQATLYNEFSGTNRNIVHCPGKDKEHLLYKDGGVAPAKKVKRTGNHSIERHGGRVGKTYWLKNRDVMNTAIE